MAVFTPVSTALVSTVWFAVVLLVVSAPPETPKVQFEAAFQGHCGHESPCEHLCFELHDGMFECDCKDGFILHQNGYSCLGMNATMEPFLEENDILYQKDASFSAELDTGNGYSETNDDGDSDGDSSLDSSYESLNEQYAYSVDSNMEKVKFVPKGKTREVNSLDENFSKLKEKFGNSSRKWLPLEERTTTQSPNLEQKVPNVGDGSQQTTESLKTVEEEQQNVARGVCTLECGKGTCLVEESGADRRERCQCPLGKGGQRCELEMELRFPRFSGQSYLAFAALRDAYKDVQLAMEFRPESWDGILMLTGERDDMAGDYMVLFLHEGFVEFRFDCGSGLGVVRSPEPILLNQWNKLTLYRHRWDAWIQLNNGKHMQGRSKGLFSRITFREPVFVGGPGNTTGVAEKLPVDDGLHGCIRHLEINDAVYGFNLSPQGNAMKGFDVAECSADLCSRVPCQHGGKCVTSAESAVCLCPLGYVGELCETRVDLQVPSFNGSSYLKYPGLGSSVFSWLDLQVIFKPNALNGVIMYNGYRSDGVGDFMAVYMIDGHVEFTFDLGTGAATIRSSSPVTLSEWHEVRISRTGRLAILEVDNQSSTQAMTPGAFTQLSLPQNLYIGGVPNFDMVSPKVKVRTSFIGCIQKIVINNRPLKILAAALSGVNVENCPHPCVAKPCANGGECIPEMEYFTCECILGYKDVHCETAMEDDIPTPRFTGLSYLHYTDSDTMKRIINNKININMRFRTSSEHGLLLWSGRHQMTPSGDFVALGVQNGHLHFRYNLGSGEVVINYNLTKINDGLWHRVKAIRNEQEGSLIVDNGPIVTSRSPGKLRQLNTNTGLYIGGMENVEQATLNKYKTGIVGCISDLILDTDYHVKLVTMSTAGRNIDHCG